MKITICFILLVYLMQVALCYFSERQNVMNSVKYPFFSRFKSVSTNFKGLTDVEATESVNKYKVEITVIKETDASDEKPKKLKMKALFSAESIDIYKKKEITSKISYLEYYIFLT